MCYMSQTEDWCRPTQYHTDMKLYKIGCTASGQMSDVENLLFGVLTDIKWHDGQQVGGICSLIQLKYSKQIWFETRVYKFLS